MRTSFLWLALLFPALLSTGLAQYWHEVPIKPDFHLRSVKFVNNDVGFIAGSLGDGQRGVLLTTKDGGVTWESRELDFNLVSIHFLDENHGYACPSYLHPLETTDGGITWDTLENFHPPSGINRSICFVNDTLGFLSGTYLGGISRTTDGGQTSTNVFSND